MTEQKAGMDSMEGRHLNESVNLIREDLREMRAEIREGLERRPTHSDLGALKQLVDKQIEMLGQRMEQDKLSHTQAMDHMRVTHAQTVENLNKEYTKLETQLKAIKADAETTQQEKKNLQRVVVVGFLTTIGGLIGTNVWQGVLG